MRLWNKILFAALAVGLATDASAGELPDSENMQGLQFNFSPPGARSLGMGGAFLARADDATAAYANPAGLTNLFSSEFSIEYRNLDYTSEYISGGSVNSPTRADASSDSDTLSYISFVLAREDWVWSVYRHQLMDFNTTFERGEVSLDPLPIIVAPRRSSLDVEIANYGASFGYRVSDRFSLGLGISYYDYSMDGFSADISPTGTGDITNEIQTGSDDDWGFNIGGLFQATDTLSIGVVYRSAPEFDTAHTFSFLGVPDEFSRSFNFEAPDMYGIGFSLQPNENLTLSFDVVQLEYSNLASVVFSGIGDFSPEQTQALAKMDIDDGTEFHAGIEYVLKNRPVALRAGVWHDPAHTLTFNGPAEDINQSILEAFYPGGDDELHYSLGLGVFFSNFQLDFAADFSDIQDTISVSAVYRFN